jgi:hypothetical protein
VDHAGKTCPIFYGVASRSWKENAMPVRAALHYALKSTGLSVGELFYRNFGLADKSARDEREGQTMHLICLNFGVGVDSSTMFRVVQLHNFLRIQAK